MSGKLTKPNSENESSLEYLQRLPMAIANLDAWLQTMRQPGGYGGPVVHWWRHSLLYAGPGMDWRYEGILSGYANLYRKTKSSKWLQRVTEATEDLLTAQLPSGNLRASEFEINPGTLGTPHESAAVLGLLNALDVLDSNMRGMVIVLCQRILHNLINQLWDDNSQGFNDRPGIPGRVPNKLATLAEALMKFAQITGEKQWLPYARACLDDVLRYQVGEGPLKGGVHQYAPRAGNGDGRFFPYYNARCIPGMVKGAEVFSDQRYLQSAMLIRNFLVFNRHDNRWPQIIYESRKMATTPSWLAGTADILRALNLVGERSWKHNAFVRLLDAQLPSGGYATAEGFAIRGSRKWRVAKSDWMDILPVCGWNDKVLNLLAELSHQNLEIPAPSVSETNVNVLFYNMKASYEENTTFMRIRLKDRVVMEWDKNDPWVRTQFRPPAL